MALQIIHKIVIFKFSNFQIFKGFNWGFNWFNR
jgi:hypothetical protein